MRSGILVSETSPDRRLNVNFSWDDDQPGTGTLHLVLPRGTVIARGNYVLHSASLAAPLRAHFNGHGWNVLPRS